MCWHPFTFMQLTKYSFFTSSSRTGWRWCYDGSTSTPRRCASSPASAGACGPSRSELCISRALPMVAQLRVYSDNTYWLEILNSHREQYSLDHVSIYILLKTTLFWSILIKRWLPYCFCLFVIHEEYTTYCTAHVSALFTILFVDSLPI